MPYGLSIPPKMFRDQTARQYTKQGFIVALYRALCTVGMLPLRSIAPTGIDLDTQVTETSWGLRRDTQWVFDYPTSETYMLAGVAYRPVLVLGTIGGEGEVSYYDRDRSPQTVSLYNGYRPDGPASRATIVTFGSNLLANNGFGSSVSENMNAAVLVESFVTSLDRWKQHASSADANRTAMLSVSNLNVALGPAGLLVQVGSGVDKTDNNNLMNVLYAFGASRLPGRSRIPEQDPLLGLTNPILTLRLNQASGGNYSAGTRREAYSSFSITKTSYTGNGTGAWVLGASYDLKSTVKPVFAFCFNLENIERPLFPVGQCTTLGSPRVAAPMASHVLNRLVYVLWDRWDNGADYYSPVDPNVRPEPTPAWADVWTCEGVRFSDLTAPAGEFTDPVTSKTWLSFPTAFVGQMAYETTGRTVYGAFTYNLPSLLGDAYYSLASAGFSSAFPSAVTWTPTGTTFIPDSGIDQMTVNFTTVNGTLTAVIDSFPGDAPTTAYQVACDLYNRSTTGAGGNVNPLTFQTSSDDGATWTTLVTAYCAGANTGGTHYNFVNTGDIPISRSNNGKLYLRWTNTYNTGGYGTITQRVRNIHIKRFG